ncbi:BTB/POZ protein [Penicillium viridicatum]|nr:BTB/POZ protein [Penicillium viridicatum]
MNAMSTSADIQDVMRDLFLRGQFSDMELICQGINFKAHRAIVCTQSRYFNSAMCDGFKESTEKSIRIQEDIPETIERVLSYLHLREYDDSGTIQCRTVPKPAPSITDVDSSKFAKNIALNNMRVFIAADKFGIAPLQSSATQKFSKWAAENWNSPVFPEVIQEVMESVPSYESNLQEVVVDIICTHIFNLPGIIGGLEFFRVPWITGYRQISPEWVAETS